MRQQRPYFDKDTTKFYHEFCQVLNEVAHLSPALGGFWQFGSDVICHVSPIGVPELILGLIPETGADPFSFKLVEDWVLWRSAKLRSHYINFFIFNGCAIVAVEVDLVAEESLREIPEHLLEEKEVCGEIGTFIEGDPAVVIYEGVSPDDTHADLCAELDHGFCIAPYYRTHMRLMYAHYAILVCMGVLTMHPFLLVIYINDGMEGSPLCPGETAIHFIVNAYKVYGCQYVTAKEGEHLVKCGTDVPCAFVLALYDREIFLANPLAFGLRHPHPFNMEDLADQPLNVFGPILHKVDIGGIADPGISTGCVSLEGAGLGGYRLLPVALFTVVFIFLPFFLCFARSAGRIGSEFVDALDGDAFADGNKQRSIEYWRVRVFGKAANILHLWVLLNGENDLLVRKVDLMLDEARTADKSCRLVGDSDAFVIQTFVVDLLLFSPWQRIAHLSPSVCFRETLELLLHFFEGQLAVIGCDFHVGWSSFNVKVSRFLLNIQLFIETYFFEN